MKLLRYILFVFLIIQSAQAQKKKADLYTEVDAKALKVPDSLTQTTDKLANWFQSAFSTEKDRTRAAFIWVAKNIKYDVENMFAINFYEKKEEKIAKALKNRKGICSNYAALFTDICTKMGLKSYTVEGYTKQNGFTDYIPHVWCAVYVDGSWFLYDPTWGSGYIREGKFVPKMNGAYYETTPTLLLKSHMPFDYLWQFMNYPITNNEFYQGKNQLDRTKPFYNYPDSIQEYEKQPKLEQLLGSAKRIEKMGVKNSMIFDRLHHIKLEIEQEKHAGKMTVYNKAGAEYNEAIRFLNEFIQFRNNQFTPKKTDEEIQQMLTKIIDNLKSVRAGLDTIETTDPSFGSPKSQLLLSVQDLEEQVKTHNEWLTTYFSKGKLGRKAMFYLKK